MNVSSQRCNIRVFISSPGDVLEERKLARSVVKDVLPQNPFISEHFTCEPVSWDDPIAPCPMPAASTPQEAVNRYMPKPSECEIFVAIFWSRLGTPLDPTVFRAPDGKPIPSGTASEVLDAFNAPGRGPTILVYWNPEAPKADVNDPDWEEKRRQYCLVKSFFNEHFLNQDGSHKRSFKTYRTPVELKGLLASDLTRILHERVCGRLGSAHPKVTQEYDLEAALPTTVGSAKAPAPPVADPPIKPKPDLDRERDGWRWSYFGDCLAFSLVWFLEGLMVLLASTLGAATANQAASVVEGGQSQDFVLFHLVGVVLGALLFGWAVDQRGRTWSIVLAALLFAGGTVATTRGWDPGSFLVTGVGIGGQYVAINLTLRQRIPSRYRGTALIWVNGTFWLGGVIAGVVSQIVLGSDADADSAWRRAFLITALPVAMIVVLAAITLSGRFAEPRAIHRSRTALDLWQHVKAVILGTHRGAAVLCFTLIASQAFLYNSSTFVYARLMAQEYGLEGRGIAMHMWHIALANLLGALVLGWLFHFAKRTVMIVATYATSAALLAFTGLLYCSGLLGASPFMVCWMAIFFVASAAASAAYLTVAEAFPEEMQAMSIALFIASGTAIGGLCAPKLFGSLLADGNGAGSQYFLALTAAMGLAAAITWRLRAPEAWARNE